MTYFIDKDIYDFEVGDLVRLAEDIKIEIGFGLVVDIKLSFDDVYDLKILDERIKSMTEILQKRDDDFYPTKPQILVLWSGRNLITSTSTSLWMYASELAIVQKVVKDTK
jgi:hypothetical protein